MKYLLTFASLALLGAAQSASAAHIYAEVGDAGQTLATAQLVPGGTEIITGFGTSADPDSADIFAFNWGGGGLLIDTFQADTEMDTQLQLFDSSGFGILGNDDHGGACTGTPGGDFQSCLDLSAGLAAGTYYLAITGFNNDALDASNNLIFPCLFGTSDQCAADPLAGPLAGWGDATPSDDTSSYTINFSAATSDGGPAPMPEPGILVLLGIGLAGLAITRRRR